MSYHDGKWVRNDLRSRQKVHHGNPTEVTEEDSQAESCSGAAGNRGDSEGVAGVEELDCSPHRFCRTDVAKLLDVSVVEYLKTRGFDQEAPER